MHIERIHVTALLTEHDLAVFERRLQAIPSVLAVRCDVRRYTMTVHMRPQFVDIQTVKRLSMCLQKGFEYHTLGGSRKSAA